MNVLINVINGVIESMIAYIRAGRKVNTMTSHLSLITTSDIVAVLLNSNELIYSIALHNNESNKNGGRQTISNNNDCFWQRSNYAIVS